MKTTFSLLSNNRKLTTLIVFGLSLTLLYSTLTDIGITIDEPYKNRTAAKLFAEWIVRALNFLLEGNWRQLTSQKIIEEYFHPPYVYHPPLARILTGITWKLFNNYIGELKALRLSPALFFSLNIALIFSIMTEYYNRQTGLVACLTLFLIPAAYGHAHIIALDTPIAVMWFFTVFCFIKGINDYRWSIFLGVVWGLTLNTKIHAYFVPVPLFLWSFFFCRREFKNNFFAMFFISPLIVYLTNPYIWNDTLYNWFTFIEIFAKRKEFLKIPTYFLNTTYDFSAPWYYPFFLILVTTPPTLLITSFCGSVMGLIKSKTIKGQLAMLFLFNALASLALVSLGSTPTYDGVRLFLPAYSFLACLTGTGYYYLDDTLGKFQQGRYINIARSTLFATILFPAIYSLAHIHPFELSYYNIFIGGTKGAKEAGLETTYWNDPFNPEFCELLNKKFPGKSFRPDMGNEKNFKYYHEIGLLNKDIVHKRYEYDYSIVAFRQGFFDPDSWFYAKYIEPVYTVAVDGVPLLAIFPSIEKTAPANQPKTKEKTRFNRLNVLLPVPDKPNKWSGMIKVTEAGWYEFGVLSADQVEFTVDNDTPTRIEISPNKVFKEKRTFLKQGFHLLETVFKPDRQPTRFYLSWKIGDKKLGLIQMQMSGVGGQVSGKAYNAFP